MVNNTFKKAPLSKEEKAFLEAVQETVGGSVERFKIKKEILLLRIPQGFKKVLADYAAEKYISINVLCICILSEFIKVIIEQSEQKES